MAKKAIPADPEPEPFADVPAVLSIPDPPAAPIPAGPVTPVGPLVLIEDEAGGTPQEVAADAGEEPPTFRVRIRGAIYDHCSEAPDGRWIYRKG